MDTYKYFTNVIVGLLMGNIGTLETHNTTLDMWTSTSQKLSNAWISGEPDPNSQMWKDFNNIKTNKEMAAFISNYLNDSYTYEFSSLFGTQLMTKLSTTAVWDSKAGPSQMNIINQWNSMISSVAQNNENTGQNGVKSENSVLQSDAGAQQPLSDMGNSALSIGASIVTVLQRQYN
jgi:hypothetical protein